MQTDKQLKQQENLSINNDTTPPIAVETPPMIDNSPEGIKMRAYQEKIDQSPESLEMQQYQENINAPDEKPTTPKENTTGIPDNIKQGIESLSGYSLDEVRVHYNSDKPEAIEAHAYTEGMDIYIATGQEEYLPHEVWHVVQQMDGLAKKRIEVNGKGIDDKKGLEKDATDKGEQAKKGNLPLNTDLKKKQINGENPVIQRAVYEHKDTTGNKDMKAIAKQLSDKVDFAKSIVDSNPLLTGVTNNDTGYLGTWVTTFNQFLTEGTVPSFFYARYGYAIETIATHLFSQVALSPYTVSSQVTAGATRPDFVVSKDGAELAWLDITSTASKDHIKKKQGSGWSTKPYVAEILYNMPAPSDFLNTAKKGLTAEQLAALSAADETAAAEELAYVNGRDSMSISITNAIDAAVAEKGEALSKKQTQEAIRKGCDELLEGTLGGKVTPKQTQSILTAIDTIEIQGIQNTGSSWSKWAFGQAGSLPEGKSLLTKV